MDAALPAPDVLARARQSLGASDDAIYRTVARVLSTRGGAGVLADIGCGRGGLLAHLKGGHRHYIGVDAVRYDELPAGVDFRACDLDAAALPLDDAAVDTAVAIETIEHLENPRAFCRELVRITRPGGLVVITTPNQLSVLSMLTLVTRGQFSAFQENSYPAHRTALLEIDLRRIAGECGLIDARVDYTAQGRVPMTGRHYPQALARLLPCALSDNLVFSAVLPA